MKRTLALTAGGAAIAAAVLTTTAAAHADAGSVAPRSPVHRVVWIPMGPNEQCGVDECGGGMTSPTAFTMPGSGTYLASITMSFQYRAVGVQQYTVGVRFGHRTATTPSRRILAPSSPTTATVVFRTRLTGGRQYAIDPTESYKNANNTYAVGMSRILLDIDATPARR